MTLTTVFKPLCSPQLTTIELQPTQVGIAAIEMVLERTEARRTGAKTVMLSPVVVDRGSVKAL